MTGPFVIQIGYLKINFTVNACFRIFLALIPLA